MDASAEAARGPTGIRRRARRLRARWRRLWPGTLVGRTVLVVLAGVIVSNFMALTVYTGERLDLMTTARGRLVAQRLADVSDIVARTEPGQRAHLLRSLRTPGFRLVWSQRPLVEAGRDDWRLRSIRRVLGEELDTSPDHLRLGFRTLAPGERLFAPAGDGADGGLPGPRYGQGRGWGRGDVGGRGPGEGFRAGRQALPEGVELRALVGSLALADGTWLNFAMAFADLKPFWASRFFLIGVVTTLLALAVSVWAVWRASRPLTVLAGAAQRLGMDINQPPLEETGPREVRTASRAFNEMQGRLQRLIRERTQMLAAISHDLRTPITRMKLRAEFVDDREQQAKMLSDLDEMEAMIAATLSFAREDPAREAPVKLDLAALLQSLCADMADAGEDVSYAGDERLELVGRPVSLKRAFVNLIDNAVHYGRCAEVTATGTERAAVVTVEDRGPGIAAAERQRVFDPFYRLEDSRSRATGGVGLGLSVVRAAVRAHGGDIVLDDRPGGGLRAVVTLPRVAAG